MGRFTGHLPGDRVVALEPRDPSLVIGDLGAQLEIRHDFGLEHDDARAQRDEVGPAAEQ
jgi:hypothetical protein